MLTPTKSMACHLNTDWSDSQNKAEYSNSSVSFKGSYPTRVSSDLAIGILGGGNIYGYV